MLNPVNKYVSLIEEFDKRMDLLVWQICKEVSDYAGQFETTNDALQQLHESEGLAWVDSRVLKQITELGHRFPDKSDIEEYDFLIDSDPVRRALHDSVEEFMDECGGLSQ